LLISGRHSSCHTLRTQQSDQRGRARPLTRGRLAGPERCGRRTMCAVTRDPLEGASVRCCLPPWHAQPILPAEIIIDCSLRSAAVGAPRHRSVSTRPTWDSSTAAQARSPVLHLGRCCCLEGGGCTCGACVAVVFSASKAPLARRASEPTRRAGDSIQLQRRG